MSARRHNGAKRQPFSSPFVHVAIQLQLNLTLGHTRLHERDNVGESRICYALRFSHCRYLGFVFNLTKLFYKAREFHQIDCPALKRSLQGAIFRQRHRILNANTNDIAIDAI